MNSGFSGEDFKESTKDEHVDGIVVAEPVIANPSGEALDASEKKEEDAKPFDPNNLGDGVKLAPPTQDPDDLSQYSDGTSSAPRLDPNLPNATKQVNTNDVVRLNAVTGEEMDMKALRGEKTDEVEVDDEKLKKVEVGEEYQQSNTVSSIILIVFFVALVGFVAFLPEIQSFIDDFFGGNGEEVKDVTTGKLICTLSSTTAEFDRDYTRVFSFDDKKLKSAKFTTKITGDVTEDEEKLNEVDEACNKIKDAVAGLEGVEVSCTLSPSQLTQVEKFDYASYDLEKTSQAYLDVDANLPEYTLDQDIDDIQVKMRQSGYDCKKEASR